MGRLGRTTFTRWAGSPSWRAKAIYAPSRTSPGTRSAAAAAAAQTPPCCFKPRSTFRQRFNPFQGRIILMLVCHATVTELTGKGIGLPNLGTFKINSVLPLTSPQVAAERVSVMQWAMVRAITVVGLSSRGLPPQKSGCATTSVFHLDLLGAVKPT